MIFTRFFLFNTWFRKHSLFHVYMVNSSDMYNNVLSTLKHFLITGSPAYHSSATANAPYGNTLRSSSPGSGGGGSKGGAGGSHVTLSVGKVR